MIIKETDSDKFDFLLSRKNDFTSRIATRVEVDNHGRVSLPKKIVDRYNFEGQVVIEGISDGFRVWIPSKFYEYQKLNIENNTGININVKRSGR